jgi:hypothetical protein
MTVDIAQVYHSLSSAQHAFSNILEVTIVMLTPSHGVFMMVTVDLEQLKQMARKAAGNKGQVAVDGPLEVAVMSRRRL